jgi:hypothetical protein
LPELDGHLHGEINRRELLEYGKKFRIDEGIWVRNRRRSF